MSVVSSAEKIIGWVGSTRPRPTSVPSWYRVTVPPLAQAAAVVGELHAHLVRAGWDRRGGFGGDRPYAEDVVDELGSAVLGVDGPSAEAAALCDDHAVGAALGDVELGGDGERLVLDADPAVLRQAPHAREEQL